MHDTFVIRFIMLCCAVIGLCALVLLFWAIDNWYARQEIVWAKPIWKQEQRSKKPLQSFNDTTHFTKTSLPQNQYYSITVIYKRDTILLEVSQETYRSTQLKDSVQLIKASGLFSKSVQYYIKAD